MPTFKQLQDELVELIEDRSSAFVTAVPRLLNRSLLDIQKRRFWKAMETTNQFKTVKNKQSHTLASAAPRYVAHKIMVLTDGNDKVELVKEHDWQVFKQRSLVGSTNVDNADRPVSFIVMGTDMYFFPKPNAAYTIDWWYYRLLPELAADGDANWFTDNTPDLIIYGSAVRAGAFLRESPSLYKQLYEESFRDYYRLENYERYHKVELNVGPMHDYGTRLRYVKP